MLTCQVCGYQHENLISAAHLRTHGTGTKEYREKFPGHKLKKVSDERRARLSAQRNGVPNAKDLIAFGIMVQPSGS